MSEHYKHVTDPAQDAEESFGPLLRDLRALPCVEAPVDFDYQLRQRLAAASMQREPWWKRLPSLNFGLFRVPAYAYGSVAGVAALAFSLYVLESREVPQQALPPVIQEIPHTPSAPARPQSDPLSPASEINARKEQGAGTRGEAAPAPNAARQAGDQRGSSTAPASVPQTQHPDRRVSNDEDLPTMRGAYQMEALPDTAKKDSLRSVTVKPWSKSPQRTVPDPGTQAKSRGR